MYEGYPQTSLLSGEPKSSDEETNESPSKKAKVTILPQAGDHEEFLRGDIPSSNLDESGIQLFQNNFEKIKKVFEDTKSLLMRLDQPEVVEPTLNDLTSIFALSVQYSFDCLLQGKNIPQL